MERIFFYFFNKVKASSLVTITYHPLSLWLYVSSFNLPWSLINKYPDKITVLIIIQKTVSYTAFFILYYSIQIYIFYAFENIRLDKRVVLLQFGYQFLCFKPFWRSRAVFMAGSTGICKMTCALKEMQFIIIPPCTDITLPYKI